jgi:hypothetical protein
MRGILSLLLVSIALAACQDAVAPAPDAAPALARGGGGPGPVTVQSLAASIGGPGAVGNYTTCTFTSSVSGGTAPYSYSWTMVGATNGYLSLSGTSNASVSATGYYYGSWGGTGYAYLVVTVTDANGLTASPYKRVDIPYYSTSC